MIGLFDKWGQRVDCTVLYVDNCQVKMMLMLWRCQPLLVCRGTSIV
jgi:hypothetical protein